MFRSLPLDRRMLVAALVTLGLAAAAVAGACPDPKHAGSCSGGSNPETEVVILASSNQDPVVEPATPAPPAAMARFRDGDHRTSDRSQNALQATSSARGSTHLAAERVVRASERRSPPAPEAVKPAKEPAGKRTRPSGGGDSRVARPHRMPSPEIL